jgi:hypothetical protein
LALNPLHGENWLGFKVLVIAYICFLFVSLIIEVKVRLNIQFALEQVTKAQRGTRDIALHFL